MWVNSEGEVVNADVRTATLTEVINLPAKKQIEGVWFGEPYKEFGEEIYIGHIDEFNRAGAWRAVASIIKNTTPELEE